VERKPMLWISGVGCVRQILLKIRTWMPETLEGIHTIMKLASVGPLGIYN
jgi:hypothetical protein